MKEIKLTQGKVALVDDADFDFLNQWKWCAVKFQSNIWYAERAIRIFGKNIKVKMHRLILGVTDTKMQSDHRDHNGLNNQRSNLRLATQQQNNLNRSSHINSASKHKGVSINTRKHFGKLYSYWRVRVSVGSKSYNIGSFKTEKEAATAYNIAATRLHGEFANLNIV